MYTVYIDIKSNNIIYSIGIINCRLIYVFEFLHINIKIDIDRCNLI